VMVRVVSEVIVRSLAMPVMYAAPAPTNIATTSREAMTPFLMPSEGSLVGCKVLLVRTVRRIGARQVQLLSRPRIDE
jgi:hypothetical protein